MEQRCAGYWVIHWMVMGQGTHTDDFYGEKERILPHGEGVPDTASSTELRGIQAEAECSVYKVQDHQRKALSVLSLGQILAL